MVSDSADAPLVADADDIPQEHRIRGIEGARSYATIEEMLPWAEFMGFRRDGDRLTLDGQERSGRWYFSPPPDRPSNDGLVGVWHHIAYDAGDQGQLQAARNEANGGQLPWTGVFDHYFFDSCYVMSAGGRMEMCTTGPGFQIDEALDDLGNRLCLSPRVEPLRAKLERERPMIVNPRPRGKAQAKKKQAKAPAEPAEPPQTDGSPVKPAKLA
jgi:glyoxalase family protein